MTGAPGLALLGLVITSVGCGGTVKFEGDGNTGIDTATDTTLETTSDPLSDTESDPVLDPVFDPASDPIVDLPGDTMVDTAVDTAPDPTGSQCSDGVDNDGDDLIDLEDWDCAGPSTLVEGPPPGSVECSVDTHCEIGYSECDRMTGSCVAPTEGMLCDACGWRADCGMGITDEDNPDVDWCVFADSSSGNCSKDCLGDFDCPKGFVCDLGDDSLPPGLCWPFVGSCQMMDMVGTMCGVDDDCDGLTCVGGACTYRCEAEHHCVFGYSCVGDVCLPD